MRGKRDKTLLSVLQERIIPAHAGQTANQGGAGSADPDHPRACGANPRRKPLPAPALGSSPRMRGKPALEERSPVSGRIIPAHAGQTGNGAISVASGTDHPRACGANSAMTS